MLNNAALVAALVKGEGWGVFQIDPNSGMAI